jgi:DNA-binding transcriptional regulator YiaG
MKCLRCKKELTAGRYTFSGEYRGEAVDFEMDGLGCQSCGFRTVKASQSAEYGRAKSDAYRAKHHLLTSGEIRAARAARGVSQEVFAPQLGVSLATLKRAEGSHAQDRKTDDMMRRKLDPARMEREVFDSFWQLTLDGSAVELLSLESVVDQSLYDAFSNQPIVPVVLSTTVTLGEASTGSAAPWTFEAVAAGQYVATRNADKTERAADTQLALAA